MERKDLDKEIGFISRHYKTGLFTTEKTLRKIKSSIRKVWTWQRIAAVSCIMVVIGAGAAVIIRNAYISDRNIESKELPVEIEKPVNTEVSPETISRIIDFDNAPLTVVIDQINSVYDVEVINLPSHAEEFRLSLHYEGNVTELIETINEILGTNLEIEK